MRRGDRSGGGIFFEEQNAEIQLSRGHFRIQGDGFFVFRAGFIGLMQAREGVGELKMGVGDVWFFREKFLEWGNCRGEIVFIERGLGLIEEIVQRILDLLRLALAGFRLWILCGTADCAACRSSEQARERQGQSKRKELLR